MEILGVKLNNYSENELVESLLSILNKEKSSGNVASYVNVHGMNIACDNPGFRSLLNKSMIVFTDGEGLKKVFNLLNKTKIKQAMTPPSWMHRFFSRLDDGTSIFLIGDERNIVEKYYNSVKAEFDKLEFKGYSDGFFLKEGREGELIKELKDKGPDIVLVGMGMPLQEKWIFKVKEDLDVRLWIPVGAYFKRMTGVQSRPPEFVAKMGMEWFYRLLSEPRLLKRYVVGNPLFIIRLIKQKFTLQS